jgi:hypothetical protein
MSDDRSLDVARWLDGEMTPDEVAAFEAEMDGDPALRAQIEDWQGNDAALRAAFAEQPVPDALVALVDNHQAFKRNENVVDLAAAKVEREARKPRQMDWRWVGAIAASLVVAVGIGTQLDLAGSRNIDPVTIALAETPSGVSVAMAKGDQLTPTLTVPVRDGYCREFRLEGPSGPRDGLACQTGKDGWQVKRIEPGVQSGGDGYQQVGGADHPAFDAIYRDLGASDPLDPASEKAAITKRWKK